jgi:hypothetical protein
MNPDNTIVNPKDLLREMHFREDISVTDDLVLRIMATRPAFYNAVVQATDRYLSRYVSLYDGTDDSQMSANRREWAQVTFGDVQQSFRSYFSDLALIKLNGGYEVDVGAALSTEELQVFERVLKHQLNSIPGSTSLGRARYMLATRICPPDNGVWFVETALPEPDRWQWHSEGGIPFDDNNFHFEWDDESESMLIAAGSWDGTQARPGVICWDYGGQAAVLNNVGERHYFVRSEALEEIALSLSGLIKLAAENKPFVSTSGTKKALPIGVLNASRQVKAFLRFVASSAVGLTPIIPVDQLP